MASDDGYVYVDDNDSSIVLSDNWGVSSISYAYDGTLHGASVADATATFTFTGTAISVVGGIGAVSEYGWPSSSYAIDGKVVGTYNLVTDGQMDDYNQFTYNFTYFNSPVLSPGKHTLVVTTLNGTAPNTYWLDYIRFLPPGAASSASAIASASHPSTTSPPTHSSTSAAGSVSNSPTSTFNTSGSTSLSSSASSTSSSNPSGATSLSSGPSSSQSGGASGTPSLPPSAPSATNSQSSDVVAGASSHSSHVGAIIGGAVGGAVLLALLAILGVYLFLRRRARAAHGGDMLDKMYYDAPPPPGAAGITSPTEATSFLPSTPGPPPTSAAFVGQPIVPAMVERDNADVIRSQSVRKDRTGFTSSTQLRPGTPAGASGPSTSSVGDTEDSVQAGSSTGLISHSGEATASMEALSAKAAQSAVVQEVDSGFRVPVGGGTLPPPYTAV